MNARSNSICLQSCIFLLWFGFAKDFVVVRAVFLVVYWSWAVSFTCHISPLVGLAPSVDRRARALPCLFLVCRSFLAEWAEVKVGFVFLGPDRDVIDHPG
jgi:hypothetical protein